MNLIETVKSWFSSPPPPPPKPRLRRLPSQRARLTINDSSDVTIGSPLFIVPPPDADSTWRTLELDSKTLSRLAPADLMGYIVDLSTEVSRALFDFIRMFNPGWECEVYRLNPASERIDRRGQAAAEAFLSQLETMYGSVDVLINRLILAGFLRGAFFAELVLDEQGRLPVDLATPDPYSARFRKVTDPVRGTIYRLGQYQRGGWVDIDSPTVQYIPIDPLPSSPYGRSLVGPAVFLAIFLTAMLRDLRRVVQQQGYPRLDLEVDLEQLREAMPGDLADNPDDFQKWVDAVIETIGDVYGNLEPDDAYVHTSVVKVNRPVGTVDASSLGAVDGLIMALERMITRALKTMPLLMGLQDSSSEVHANRQWEIHNAGIKSVQRLLESLLSRLFTVMLQAQGIQARVCFEFEMLRNSEELRDEQAKQQKFANLITAFEQGWISQDEAAEEAVGHAPDAPGPRGAGNQPAPGQQQPVQGDGDGQPVQSDESRVLITRLEAYTNGHTKPN